MKQEEKPLGSVDNEAEYVVTHTSSAQEPSPWGEVTPSPWTSTFSWQAPNLHIYSDVSNIHCGSLGCA